MTFFTSWDQEMTYDESIIALKAISETIAPEEFRRDHPDFPWGDPVRMLDYSFDYKGLDSDAAARLRQVHALYRKFEPLKIPGAASKEAVAWEKFLRSEIDCRKTNTIFDNRMRGKLCFHPAHEEILLSAQKKIAAILGKVPELSQLKPRLGPGGTTTVPKKEASPANKFAKELACSEPLVPYLSEVLYELPALLDFEGDTGVVDVVVHHGRLTFVPKDAKQYRSVVTEPLLSGMYQMAIGDFMKKRLLLRAGLDISDQSINQEFARMGSLTGELATLDLSSASDTVSTELVAFLLPNEWWWFLRRFRSSSVTYKDDVIYLEKFSSMGNGFTFALETLIFYAIAASCCSAGEPVRAYGDDIIVPAHRAKVTIEVLELCGFTINTAKSYVEGPFRESCGADYLLGIDIRPFYFDDLVSCERIFSFHNFLIREGKEAEAEWLCRTYLHPDLIIWGPDGYGDGHLIGKWVGSRHNRDYVLHEKAGGWGGFLFETYSWKARYQLRRTSADHIVPGYTIYSRHPWDAEQDNNQSNNYRVIRRRGFLRRLAHRYSQITESCLPVIRGNPRCSLPGKTSYKRIKIYTFETPNYIL